MRMAKMRLVLPNCPTQNANVHELQRRGISVSGQSNHTLPALQKCVPREIHAEIVFQYSVDTDVSTKKQKRLSKELRPVYEAHVKDLNAAFNPLDKYFEMNQKVHIMTNQPPEFEPYTAFRVANHIGNATTLNVSFDLNPDPMSYVGITDGIVIKEGALILLPNEASASTLIHETGHWLGLKHVFEGDCKGTDHVDDTPQYPDDEHRWQCYQKRCGKEQKKHVSNYMSYSPCSGLSESGQPILGFMRGQRARMFAFHAFHHLGKTEIEDEEKYCRAVDDRVNTGGAASHQLLAEFLLNNCSVAIQDAYDPSSINLAPEVLARLSAEASAMQVKAR
ncbi:hypothetical protein EJ04DRAFT_528919 [Polyplosphaeria fusca]|uniref:Peptidase M43 pregnancy-associated plasma-A domain-containing protein n=1 Tax=Polyplosphaeria fusca TaxID=682080 RepID=A0A9P4QIT1_9PLEO|nr:hypothetical protein EJ04DRAFT_528919 [Polyplosphaeria fusca]